MKSVLTVTFLCVTVAKIILIFILDLETYKKIRVTDAGIAKQCTNFCLKHFNTYLGIKTVTEHNE